MTTKTWWKAILTISIATATLTTGCTFTMGDHSITAATATQRETMPHTSGASLAYDDHPERGR